MSYHEQLTVEINKEIDRRIDAGEALLAQWIAHALCEEFAEGLADNENAEFWRHGGYKHCRDEVRRCINRRVGSEPKPEERQLKLPGFEHLQSYYMVTRDGDEVGIPVYDMTDDEIAEKARFYRKMGAGCYAHADELDRFKRDRREENGRVAAE